MIFQDEDINAALEKLQRYSTARDRITDPYIRTFELTDDEGLALLLHIELLTSVHDPEHEA